MLARSKLRREIGVYWKYNQWSNHTRCVLMSAAKEIQQSWLTKDIILLVGMQALAFSLTVAQRACTPKLRSAYNMVAMLPMLTKTRNFMKLVKPTQHGKKRLVAEPSGMPAG